MTITNFIDITHQDGVLQAQSAIESGTQDFIVLMRSDLPGPMRSKVSRALSGTKATRGAARYGMMEKGVVDHAEQAVIMKIVKLRGQGLSLAKIMLTLNKEEVWTRSGQPWQPPYLAKVLSRFVGTNKRQCRCGTMPEVIAKVAGKSKAHFGDCPYAEGR